MFKRFTMRSVFVLFVLLGSTLHLAAQRSKAPSVDKLLSSGGQGTEFWVAIPPNEILPFPVEGLEIYVASAFDANVELFDFAGDRSTRFKLKPYEVRTLSDRKELNWSMEIRDAEMPVRKALRLTSDKPISVYVINSKVTTTDGYMAIPTNGWGQDYISVSYWDFREVKPWPGGFMIIAKEPTTVDILLRGQGKNDATTSNGRRIGERISVFLDEGEVYMVHGDGQTRAAFDLSGSLIRADKPVGFISFHMRTTMPNLLINGNGRNHLCEMLPPITAWGKRYSTVELKRARRLDGRGDVFKVVAKDDQTRWTMKYYDKTNGKLLGQNGGLLAKAGDFADITQATQPTAITEGFSVWEANKPIFVMQYSCSSSWDGDQILDPFMFNVTPEEQFITSTIFQSPTMAQFTKHYLNLIVKTDTSDKKKMEENLKSLEIDGIPVWSDPRAEKPSLLFTRMPNGLFWASIEFGTDARAHRISGNGLVSFGGYIYGFGAVDAYGWPAAAGFRPTTSVDTLAPVIKGDSLCGDYKFEATELRNIPDPPREVPVDTDQVETGIALIDTVPGQNSYNYRLELITDQIFPQAPSFKRFKYEWQVIDKSKDARAIYYVRDFADNVTLDTCYYFADKLVITPDPLLFGKIRLGSKKTLPLTIKNNSDVEVTLTASKMLAGTYFKIASGQIPDGKEVKIPGRGSYTIDIEYSGTRETSDVTKDWDKDTIQINTSCGLFKHGMTGVAAIPRIKVRDFDAGTRGLNEKFCGPLLIENPGSDTLVITAITGYDNSAFSLSAGYTPALPISIPPRGRVELKDVCFVSDKIIDETKDVTFANNGDGPDSVSKWTGNTQTPGPGITGYDWLLRRVGTRHPWIVKVYNTGNQEIILNDVNFATGGKFFPAGSDESNFVFKIGNLIKGGSPVTTATLKGDSVDVEVFFRPGGEQAYTVDITPVWATSQDPRSARLAGEGIIPKISSQPITLTCAETPEGDEVRRDFVLTNGGTMPLTVTDIRLATGAPAGYALITAPTFPVTVAANGGVYPVTVAYTRPFGFGNATNVDLEVVHDATPGTGVDATTLVSVGPHTQRMSVASCSSPDIATVDLDFGRNRANCDDPTREFTISNPSGSLKPLEIKDIRAGGPDAAAFTITQIRDAAGTVISLPIILTAGQTATVSVKFTPTEPNAAPWQNRVYSAQYEIDGYAQGETKPFKTVTSKLTGIGFVTPVSMALGNDLGPTEAKNPGNAVAFRVSANSADWNSADLRSFTADVLYDPATIAFTAGSLRAGASAPGWTITGPTITTISADQARMTFTASGPAAIRADGDVFSFNATLLLSDKVKALQNLEINLGRPCLIPSTTGDSTGIFNCALSRRVINVSGARTKIAPVSPNPVRSGTATVEFGVGISAPVTIQVINAQGQVVRTLVSGHLQWGEYDMSFDTQGLSAGAYFIRMQTVEFDRTQPLMIQD